MVETQVLRGERGAYHLAKPLTRWRVPATVQAILAARMDRLPPAEKRLLQSAAVLGREIPLPLLQALTETPEDDLRQGLAHLQQAEFLVETRLYPELVYAFTHALTHDVAYASLLRQQRRELHARIVAAIERLCWAGRLSTQVEHLAHHAVRGELWDKALVYCREAGHKASLRSAHRAAEECFEQALEALQHLPETSETMEQVVDLHFEARNALLPLGERGRIFDHLQTWAYLTEHFRQTGDLTRAVDSGEQALALATELEDFALQIMATCFLGIAYSALGEYQRAADAFSSNVAALAGERGHERFGMTGLPAVISRTWLVSCLADLGAFDDGMVRGNEAVQMAEAAEHSFSLMQAYYALGTLFLQRGELCRVIPVLQRGLALCQGGGIVAWFPTVAAALGYAYTLAGRMAEAFPLLQQAVAPDASQSLSAGHARRLAYLSEASLLAGRDDEAAALAAQALTFARNLQARGIEAYALWLHGEIQAHQASPEGDEAAEGPYQQALTLAKTLGMRPLQARCHLALGSLATRRGQLTQARADLASAMALFEAMGMTFWLPRAQAMLAQTGGELG